MFASLFCKEDLGRLEEAVKALEVARRIAESLAEWEAEEAEYREQRRRATHGGGVITEELADTAPEERRAKKQRRS